MIDPEGYRPNVGIILCNAEGRLFWGRRFGQHSWQFPQGGIQRDESPEQAMFRELAEEVGLRPEHVQVVGCTRGWLRYRLPRRLIRPGNQTPCIGQKQVWFLLRMLGSEESVRLDASNRPEFDHWQWVDYWYPLHAVVPFKRQVYWHALHELAPLLFQAGARRRPSPRRRNPGVSSKSAASRMVSPAHSMPPASLFEPTALQAGVEVALEAMALGAIALEAATQAARPAASPTAEVARSASPPALDPVLLRRVEPKAHPVITRMVVSVRRSAAVETLGLNGVANRDTPPGGWRS